LNKKFVIVIISLLSTILLASEATKALNLAKSYEKDGNIKKAMEQYKKAALILSKPMEKSEKNQKILTYGNNSIESYEDKKTDETVEQIIYSAFDIEAYRMNYLLPLTYDSKNHTNHDSHSNRKKVETKFQISLRNYLKIYLA